MPEQGVPPVIRRHLIARVLVPTLLACAWSALPPARATADEILEKYRKAVDKGLDWLSKQQSDKGYWGASAGNDTYCISMTGLSGMALLMEGSTVKEGKYADNIRKAADWLMDKCQEGNQRDGLIGDPTIPSESARYMYGHGFGLMFLASVYGEETDAKKRARLKDILTRAVQYTINAQSSRGGWYYVSKADGHDQDEGSVTITQVQALRAARNAGIPVPKDAIRKTYEYLKACTSPRGAVYYSWNSKQERSAITAAAVACLFNAGEYKDELGKKWLKYCREWIPPTLGNNNGPRLGHDEYTHYYFSQCVYILGDNGWEKLFGPTPASDRLTWTAYRNTLCDQLLQIQNQDGSWSSGGGFSVGPVYSTAMYLAIMQLDRGVLPIYQR
jgi:hypothetical protein